MQRVEEHIREECGVFGIWGNGSEDAAHTIYQGLLALQHRGQESAGIVVCDTKGPIGNITCRKEMGLVSEIFHRENLEQLHGNIGIGHVRYSTTGGSEKANAQPIVLNYLKGTLALAHNGNIINAAELREELQQDGAVFNGTSDSETVAYKIAKCRVRCSSIEEAVIETARQIRGGYALLILSPRKLIAVRDPFGIKPLCVGKLGESYLLASESCAIESVGGTVLRDVEPGEVLAITKEGMQVVDHLQAPCRAHCIFEYIYFARVDSRMDGISVYDARIRGGRALARRYPVEADVVTGVPDSGLVAAVGYARESGIPFELAFHKNSYIGRTFIKPTQEERVSSVQAKLNVLASVVRGKRVVLIDDSIVRGTTIANLIRMMRKSGAKEVHVRISSPPFLYPCYYGTDVPDNSQLIANHLSTEEICRQIGADSLGYMKIEDFSCMTGDLPLCRACFDNHYPVKYPETTEGTEE
ncbi:MAG: amidophosphoribosyltransferase [Eubacteriales bacterium]|nr:amidophosphoribosyltransferase [Eubacteriales bacterium]